MAKKGANYLSKELKTNIQIDSLKIKDLQTLEIYGLRVDDQKKDTLLRAKIVYIKINNFQNLDFKNHVILIDQIRLDSAHFYLQDYSNHRSNLDFLIDYFSGKKNKSPSKPYLIKSNFIELNEFRFKYLSEPKDSSYPRKINYSDLDLNHIQLKISSLAIKGSSINATIDKFHFEEKSGFKLVSLQSQVYMDSKKISLTKLNLVTPYSHLGDQLSFQFKSWSDFADFTNLIHFKSYFKNSNLNTQDLSYFTSETQKIKLNAKFSGYGSGTLIRLNLKEFKFRLEDSTEIKGDFIINNITSLKNLFLETQNASVKTNRKELNSIFRNIGRPELIINIPTELSSVRQIRIEGALKGTLSKFSTDLKVISNLGTLRANLNFTKNGKGLPIYNGKISSSSFALREILGEPKLGVINFSTYIFGQGLGNNIKLDTLVTIINKVTYRGYQYQNIQIVGSQHQKSFSGKVVISDPNLALNFKGLIDLNSKIPAFNFNLNITKADLRKLKFTKDSLSLQTHLNFAFTGNNLNTLNGQILATNTLITKGKKSFFLDSILLGADKLGLERTLYLKSCIADLEMKGRYDFQNLPMQLKEVLGKYLPSTHWNRNQTIGNQEFNLNVTFKDASAITGLIDSNLYISPGSHLLGNFNSRNQVLSLSGIFPDLGYKSIHLGNTILDAENLETGSLDINISSDQITAGKGILARSIFLFNTLKNDSLVFNLKVEDVNSINRLDLNGQIAVNNTEAGLSILPSELKLENKVWKIENSFKISYQPGKTEIKGFEISHNQESVALNGVISTNSEDSVSGKFHQFNINSFNQILKQYGFSLNGNLNGKANISAILGNPSFSSILKIDSFGVNGHQLGNADLNTLWDGKNSNLVFNGKIKNKILNSIQLDGKLGLSEKSNLIEANLNMDHAEAALLEPFTKGIVSDLKGTLSSNIKVSGKRDQPILNGTLNFNSLGLTVDYLNTHYTFNDSVTLNNGLINLKNIKLYDPYRKTAIVNGSIDLTNLNNPFFSADLHAENFLSLNTNDKQGEEYYGRAFSTGDYSFEGPLNHINILIDASTMPGTTLNIPLNRPNTIDKKDYITFVFSKDSIRFARNKRISHKGTTLDFNLNITPDAQVKLIFDEKIGDIIQGSGTSDLNLQINNQGDFLMYGTFEIEKGNYLFTSQNILNKLFTVEKGGTIRFNGDPQNADIDLFADYQARAFVDPLYQAANVSSILTNSSAVLVNSNIHLVGTLSEPSFNFSLKFPLTPVIEQELATYLNSKEIVTTQSLLFLISNQFNGELTPNNGIGVAASTGIQFVSNQLSNLLVNFSSRIDLNFRSLGDYGVAFRSLNDRLRLTGDFANIQAQTNNVVNLAPNFDRVTGDAEASYSLNKKGSIRIKGFFRIVPVDLFEVRPDITIPDFKNNIQTLSQSPVYTQGLGILYEKDFSSLRDLFRKRNKKNIKNNSRLPINNIQKVSSNDDYSIQKNIQFRDIKN